MFIISVWIFHWKMNAEKNAKAYRVYHVPLATITAERAIFLLQIEVNLIKQQYCSSITENNLSQKNPKQCAKQMDRISFHDVNHHHHYRYFVYLVNGKKSFYFLATAKRYAIAFSANSNFSVSPIIWNDWSDIFAFFSCIYWFMSVALANGFMGIRNNFYFSRRLACQMMEMWCAIHLEQTDFMHNQSRVQNCCLICDEIQLSRSKS